MKVIWESNPDIVTDAQKETYYKEPSNYQNINYVWYPRPWRAWTYPVIVGQMYKIHWRQGLSFDFLQMDWSVLSTESDSATVFHQNFTAVRAAFHVGQANKGANQTYNRT